MNNDLFLLDYGFVVPANPYDCIELKYDSGLLEAASMAAGVSSPNFASPSPWQRQILQQLNLDGENPDLKVNLVYRSFIICIIFDDKPADYMLGVGTYSYLGHDYRQNLCIDSLTPVFPFPFWN